jgi:hypothetical protein
MTKKWLAPEGPPKAFLPEPNFDWVVVRSRLEKAKLAGQEEAVVAFLKAAFADYKKDQIADRNVAWGGQVEALLVRMRKAELALRLSKPEGTILGETKVPIEQFWEAQATVRKLVRRLEKLLKSMPDREQGGWPAVAHARQLRLAMRFWGAFTTNKWRTETSANSLMAQLLKLVFEAAGEKRATIKTLLVEAEAQYIKSKTSV